MLKLFSGKFHPDLEQAFLKKVIELKKDPIAPVLIVTASSGLKEHLQKLLGQESRAFLNLHFHTLSTLAEEIALRDGGVGKALLSDGLFYDTLIQSILKKNRPFHSFEDMAVPHGFPAAVRSTLRDLLDAGVDADLIQAAMEEEFVGRTVDLGSLRELLSLYRSYLSRVDNLPVSPVSASMKKAIGAVESSLYLKQFEEILFYGFYDLTGLQSEFFETIVKNFSSCYFFPYEESRSEYAFAKRFRDNVLQRIEFLEEKCGADLEKPKSPVSVFNVSGFSDEAWLVGREIGRLVEEEGYAPADIAVVARTRERLSSRLPAFLHERRIPFQTTAKASLLDWPLASSALNLVKSGFSTLPNRKSSFASIPEFNGSAQDAFSEVTKWPKTASWTDYSHLLKNLLERFFNPQTDESKKIMNLLMDGLTSLELFDLIDSSIPSDEFILTVEKRWRDTDPQLQVGSPKGVALLHAEAARGRSFKIIILIGLEEKVFPRIIREDPFLRDDARLALRDTVGYKIGQKLTALEEERLLFHLITSAALERLVYIYQRSDDEGKVVGASPFLRADLHERGVDMDSVICSIPRPALAKILATRPEHLTHRELLIRLMQTGDQTVAAQYLNLLGQNGAALAERMHMQMELQSFDHPGPFDGQLGSLEWRHLFPDGTLSASSLENYARCPFQFFAGRMLGLPEPEETGLLFEFPAQEKGLYMHLFLKKFFEELTEGGRKKTPPIIPEALFDKVTEEVLQPRSDQPWSLAPVVWKVARETMISELRSYLEVDLERLSREDRIPVHFEKKWSGELSSLFPSHSVMGIIDRIDADRSSVHVIDYKTGAIPGKKVIEDMLRGRRVQPSLYLLIAEQLFKQASPRPQQFQFSFQEIADEIDRVEISQEAWDQSKADIFETLKKLVSFMTDGLFPLIPQEGGDRYCDYCHVQSICRRHHSLSAYRAQQGPVEPLMALRSRREKGDSGDE